MTQEEKTYFLRRAEVQLRLANDAMHPAASRAHYTLAGFYLDRAYGDGAGGPQQPRRRVAILG